MGTAHYEIVELRNIGKSQERFTMLYKGKRKENEADGK